MIIICIIQSNKTLLLEIHVATDPGVVLYSSIMCCYSAGSPMCHNTQHIYKCWYSIKLEWRQKSLRQFSLKIYCIKPKPSWLDTVAGEEMSLLFGLGSTGPLIHHDKLRQSAYRMISPGEKQFNQIKLEVYVTSGVKRLIKHTGFESYL